MISSIIKIYRKLDLFINELPNSFIIESILNVIREIDFFGDKNQERLIFLLNTLKYYISTLIIYVTSLTLIDITRES